MDRFRQPGPVTEALEDAGCTVRGVEVREGPLRVHGALQSRQLQEGALFEHLLPGRCSHALGGSEGGGGVTHLTEPDQGAAVIEERANAVWWLLGQHCRGPFECRCERVVDVLECGVVGQDRALELAQPRPWLDAELVGERPMGPPVDGHRVRLPA